MRQRGEWSRTISRRRFLGALGAGAVASGVSSTLFARAVQAQTVRPRAFVLREDRFGRMFPNLDPFFRDNSSRLRAAMQDIGKLGGMMDRQGPARGWRQGGGHRADRRSRPQCQQPQQPVADRRQHVHRSVPGPRHDVRSHLASGRGDRAHPVAQRAHARVRSRLCLWRRTARGRELYVPVPTGGPKLRIEHGGLFEDLPRNRDGSAIIADPRNDENMMIAGLQAAVIMFHNKCVDLVRPRSAPSSEEVFAKARHSPPGTTSG